MNDPREAEQTPDAAPEPFVPEIDTGPYVDPERTIPDLMEPPADPAADQSGGIRIGETVEVPPEPPKSDKPEAPPEPSGKCEHCQRDVRQVRSEMQPSDDDKRRFRRYLQGEPRFVKEYELLGGSVRAVFRSRHTRETEAIFATLTELLSKNELGPGPAYGNPAYHLRMDRLMLAATLEKVELQSEEGQPARLLLFDPLSPNSADRPTSAQVLAVEAAAMDKLDNEALFSMLLGRLRHFEQLVGTLISRSTDPDFWPATGGTR